jgi:phage recombination protein Bet
MSIVPKDMSFTPDQVDLIKRTICKGATDDELALFLHACRHLELDPFLKQIYGIKRANQMTIQISIDGYRAVAEKTKQYVPGREPSFTYDKDGRVFSATAYVKKLAVDGSWHEVSATAFMNEYAVSTNSTFWTKMPHNQLAKCAESLALRRAFPAQLSGTYTKEEMEAAPSEEVADIEKFQALYSQLQEEEKKKVDEGLKGKKIAKIEDLTNPLCADLIRWMERKVKTKEEIVKEDQSQ